MDGSGDSSQTHGPAIEFLDYGEQEFSVHLIKAKGVHFHAIERIVGDLSCYPPVVIDLGIVAHAAQQPINYARCAARAAGNFARAVFIDLNAENIRGALADNFEVFVGIEVQMKNDSETTAQR